MSRATANAPTRTRGGRGGRAGGWDGGCNAGRWGGGWTAAGTADDPLLRDRERPHVRPAPPRPPLPLLLPSAAGFNDNISAFEH